MNCKEYWNGEAHSAEHLQECPACARRAARHEELAVGLKSLGAQMRRVEAPARVERALVAAFRGQAALGATQERGSWWLAGAWAIALAATVLLAVTLVRPHEPQRSRQNTVRSRTQLAELQMPSDGSAGDADAADGEFLPMPNAELVGPNDEINLVRIELPRSAMIPLGFEVPAERAAETVEADVMLDAEGVARAVRFLDPEKSSSSNSREMSW
jgi:hypothetical protein